MINEILTIPAYPHQVYEDFWTKVRKASGQNGIKKEMEDVIIELIKSNSPKPKSNTKEYRYLIDLRRRDEDRFNKLIGECDWFNQIDHKKKLISDIKSGAPKPKRGTKEYEVFHNLIRNNKEFGDFVEKEGQKWIDHSKDAVIEAIKSGIKPECGTSEYNNMMRYCNDENDRHDEIIHDMVMELCSDWIDSNGTRRKIYIKKRKDQYLKLAKAGSPKPKSMTSDYNVLYTYTKNDKKFAINIVKFGWEYNWKHLSA